MVSSVCWAMVPFMRMSQKSKEIIAFLTGSITMPAVKVFDFSGSRFGFAPVRVVRVVLQTVAGSRFRPAYFGSLVTEPVFATDGVALGHSSGSSQRLVDGWRTSGAPYSSGRVGARKPVLAVARTITCLCGSQRRLTFGLMVEPKSLKWSTRTAPVRSTVLVIGASISAYRPATVRAPDGLAPGLPDTL